MAGKKEERKPLPPDLRKSIRRARLHLLPAFFPAILGTLLNIYLTIGIKEIMDAALAGDLSWVKAFALPMALTLLLFIPVDLLSAWAKGFYLRRANEILKGRYIDRVFAKNISEFQDQNLALYLSNITNDMNSVEQRYFLSIHEIMRQGLSALGGIIILYSVSWATALLAFIPGIIVSIFATRSGRGLERHEGERSDFLKDYTIYIREVLSAFRIIRSNALEGRIKENFRERSTAVQQKKFELDRAESRVFVRNNFFFSLLVAVLLTAAMLTARSGFITTGGVILLINGYSRIIGAFFTAAERLPQMTSVRPVFLRMEEALENREEALETEDYKGLHQELLFDKVSFSYGENKVLDQASFEIKKGGKYLMAGPSGGGKSTVLRLIRKYFNPDEGRVLIDGADLRSVTRTSYYEDLANVEQQVFLFDDSLRNNLTLFKPYTEEEIMTAVRGAGLLPFLAARPEGLDYKIEDNGQNLSGGERARIAIARGLIARAGLLLLDEAFASLDEEVARGIEKTLLELEGVTLISVSHVIFSDTAPLYDGVFEVKRGQVTLADYN